MSNSNHKDEPAPTLYDALCLINSVRANYDARSVVNLAGAYSLKRQFALKAGEEIARNYGDIIMNDTLQHNPFSNREAFEFDDPHTQLAFWVDVLLHNCRGSLETLGAILDYVYDFRIKQTSFYESLKKSQLKDIGIRNLLDDIRSDFWFEIINQLRNKSYHVMLNTFVPKIGLGIAKLRFTIYFVVKSPLAGNLSHSSVWPFLISPDIPSVCSLELGEFSEFIIARLEQYLDQVDRALIQDCIDISGGRTLRSKSLYPGLIIPGMKLPSWRVHIDPNELPGSFRSRVESLQNE